MSIYVSCFLVAYLNLAGEIVHMVFYITTKTRKWDTVNGLEVFMSEGYKGVKFSIIGPFDEVSVIRNNKYNLQ